jgi:hypothetical protein
MSFAVKSTEPDGTVRTSSFPDHRRRVNGNALALRVAKPIRMRRFLLERRQGF